MPSWRSVEALGLIVLVIFIGATTFFYVVPHDHLAFEPPLLMPILFTAICAVCCVVSYVSTRSYLRTGMLSLSLLSSAVLLLGISASIAGWGVNLVGVNAVMTIYNISIFLSACINFSSAILSYSWPSYQGTLPLSLKNRAIMAWCGVIVFEIFLTIAGIRSVFPPFFVIGVGPTSLRLWVLGAAIVLFFMSAAIFMRIHLKTRSKVLYWYSLALTLFGLGFLGMFQVVTIWCLVGWIGRFAQFTGGLYLLAAVLASIRASRNGEGGGHVVISS